MTDEKKMNEAEVMFPDIVIEGIRIRPWSFGQFSDMLPVFSRLAQKFREDGRTFKEFQDAAEDPEKILQLVTSVLPFATEIIAKTVGVSGEDVRGWEVDKALRVLVVIFTQNASRLKNCFGLGISLLQTIVKTAG